MSPCADGFWLDVKPFVDDATPPRDTRIQIWFEVAHYKQDNENRVAALHLIGLWHLSSWVKKN